MVVRLQTRCRVLAATNPKGQYDSNLSLSLNTAIASSLLSRFDLVLTLLDSHQPAWDRLVSSHLLGLLSSTSSYFPSSTSTASSPSPSSTSTSPSTSPPPPP